MIFHKTIVFVLHSIFYVSFESIFLISLPLYAFLFSYFLRPISIFKMPPKKKSVPTSLGIKEEAECHLCKKKMRFDYLRDKHFPKAHGQKYSRPRGSGQSLLSAMFTAKETANLKVNLSFFYQVTPLKSDK